MLESSSDRQGVRESWHGHEGEIRQAVEPTLEPGIEVSARLLYRNARNLMRELGIRTPADLYGALHQIYWNADEEVAFGDRLSVGLGTVDRRRQVRDFSACHADEPRNVVAMGYERKYGFSAGVVAIWLDLFADADDVRISDWLGRDRRDDTPATQETVSETSNEPVAEAPIAPDADALGTFFARELVADICDAKLVRDRFAYELGGTEDAAEFDCALSQAGYYEDHGLLFREGGTPSEHFARLIESHPSFARGDVGFEGAVWRHKAFRRALTRALEERRVLVYEPDSYLAFSRLHDVLGVCMADIDSYAASVRVSVPELEPFTIASLHARGGFEHKLDRLEMPGSFYEGLLDSSGMFRSCVMAGTRVFVAGGEGRLSAADLIEWIVARHEGIERDGLSGLLAEELGISCPSALLTTTVHNSDVYYDDIGDAYYSSMEAWKKEARNELA